MRHVWIALVFIALGLTAVRIDFGTQSTADSLIAPGLLSGSASLIDPESTVRLKLLLDSSSRATINEQVTRVGTLGRVGTVIGDVVTLDIPSSNIADLAGLGFVRKIETSRRISALLDVSVPEIGATEVWQSVKDNDGRQATGSGSLIGIVDTGIDWSHPDFFFENGTSKIAFIWDQSVLGNPPIGFRYGTECSRADIEQRLCREVDDEGHGTHVAGIAASTGLASGRYYGVAPEATILFVKAKPSYDHKNRWGTDDTALIDGVSYLWQKAQGMKKTIVINLSLGGNIGPHDDTSLLEKALNEFAARGAVIIVAAGNDGDAMVHTAGTLGGTRSVSVDWSIDDEEREVAVDVWYPIVDDFAISVETPSGEVVTGPTSSGGVLARDARIRIISSVTEKGNEWFISVTSDVDLKRSTWGFTLTGLQVEDGEWDAWISYGEFQEGPGYDVTATSTVGDPATASGVIAVGAYATKLEWLDWKGDLSGFDKATGQKLNDIASFSSIGPTRDGRTKPDIVAPGFGVASARSWKVLPDLSDPDEFHTVLPGTSMAAPHVTGLVALMLQYNPYLTVSQVMQVLKSGARTDRFTGAIDQEKGSNIWGWGKVDAKASVLGSASLFAITVSLEGLPARFSVDMSLDGASIIRLSGTETFTLELDAGTHRIEVDQVVPISAEMRYRAKDNSISVSKSGPVIFEYVIQYYLQVESERGNTTGSGWYDDGTRAAFSAEDEMRGPTGVDYLLVPWRVTYIFDHWSGDSSSRRSSDSVRMDGPKTITAAWRSQKTSDYTPLVFLAVVVMSGALVAILIHRRRGISEGPMPVELVREPTLPPFGIVPDTPVPMWRKDSVARASHPDEKFCIDCGLLIPQTAKFCLRCGAPQQ